MTGMSVDVVAMRDRAPDATAHAVEQAATPTASAMPDFLTVYEQHLAFVWRSVKRLGIPEEIVDDVVQDVFVVVFRRFHTFRGMSSMRTWLFGILRRIVRDRRRSYRRVHAVEAPWDDNLHDRSPASQHDRAEQQQAARIVRRLLAELDDDKREVFILAELEQMTAPEIAEATGAKLNTVYSRLRASRLQFEEMLRKLQSSDSRSVP